MKKISVLITLLVLSLVLSGCTKVEYNLVVTKDDVSYKGTVGLSKEMLAQLEEMGEATEGEAEAEHEPENELDEYNNELEESGFTTEEYEDDEYKGFKFEKSFGSLEDVSTKDAIEYADLEDKDNTKIFIVDDSDPTKTKYTAKLKVSNPEEIEEPTRPNVASIRVIQDRPVLNGPEDDIDDLGENIGDIGEFMGSMDLKFKVSLPVAPLTSNATSVEGTDLTWDLTQFEGEYIEFSFELPVEEDVTPLTPDENQQETNNPLSIVAGANQTYYKGTNGTITLKVSGDLSKLRGIEIDNGNPIKEEDYTVNEEEATITFKSTFLENSSLGEHTITVKYEDEEVETKLTIAEKAAPASNGSGSTTEVEDNPATADKEMNNPKTGDNVIVYIMAAILSMLVFAGSIVYIKKNNM